MSRGYQGLVSQHHEYCGCDVLNAAYASGNRCRYTVGECRVYDKKSLQRAAGSRYRSPVIAKDKNRTVAASLLGESGGTGYQGITLVIRQLFV